MNTFCETRPSIRNCKATLSEASIPLASMALRLRPFLSGYDTPSVKRLSFSQETGAINVNPESETQVALGISRPSAAGPGTSPRPPNKTKSNRPNSRPLTLNFKPLAPNSKPCASVAGSRLNPDTIKSQNPKPRLEGIWLLHHSTEGSRTS